MVVHFVGDRKVLMKKIFIADTCYSSAQIKLVVTRDIKIYSRD